MTHQSQREIPLQFVTKLTNLLFLLVMVYPFLEASASVIGNFGEYKLSNTLTGEFFRNGIPYILCIWFYFYSVQRKLSRTAGMPLLQDSERGKQISGWLQEAGLGDVTVFLSNQPGIAAEAFGTQRHRYISITQTALDKLTDDELRVLLMHEVAHHHFGDIWKVTLARSLTNALLVSRLAFSMAGFSATLNIQQSGSSTILYFLPVLLGYFAYALMSVGILAILRLREVAADTYAARTAEERAAYLQLLAKIGYHSSPARSQTLKVPIPRWFDFHRKGPKRLLAINNLDMILEDILFALAFVGLLLGSLIGIWGETSTSILLALPLLLLFGLPILYFVVNGLDQYARKAAMAFTLSGSLALTTTLLTLTWSIVKVSNPLGISTADLKSPTVEYYMAPWSVLRSDFYLAFDNYLVTFIAGGLALLLFIFVAEQIHKRLKSTANGRIPWKSILIFLIWALLSFSIAILWLDAFGPYPYVKSLTQ